MQCLETSSEVAVTAQQSTVYADAVAGGRLNVRTYGARSPRRRWQRFTASVMTAVMVLFASVASAQQGAAPSELVVAALGGALGQSIKEVFEPFEKQYNVKIRWVTAGASAEYVARVAATKEKPEYDLVFGDMATQETGSTQELWAKLDEKIVTNYKDQLPSARSPRDDIVFFGFVATGLFYAKGEFEQRGWKPPTHWSDLLNKEFCSRVGINHPNVLYGMHALIMLGGGGPDKISHGIAKFAENKGCIPVLEPTAAKLEEKIGRGEYLIGVHGSVRIIPLAKKAIPVKFVIPAEGAVIFAAGVSPVKNAAQPRLAQEFCNWILRPDVQMELMEKAFFGPTNATVKVPKAFAELGVPDANAVKRSIIIPGKTFSENHEAWLRQFDAAIAK